LPILTRCHDLGIPVTVNSDAHTPGDVAAGFEQARSLLVDIGIVPVSLA
jgi:histidinol phosphatase-like PHP family hydrolase